ncbi:MAG: hypothetical protein HY331_04035 [Chloroflexi bacterium]|nr:hypothetical protein [Chloroflexota bacterium]
MATRKRTISVRLDDAAKRRVERAARLLNQSAGAFLEKAGEEQAHHILLWWAVGQHRSGAASFSELAAETGLAVEEIMLAVGSQGKQEALDLFLASCRAVAEARGAPEFLRTAKEAAEMVLRAEGDSLS